MAECSISASATICHAGRSDGQGWADVHAGHVRVQPTIDTTGIPLLCNFIVYERIKTGLLSSQV